MIFKKLYDDSREPVRSTRHSAGLDVFAHEDVYIEPFTTEMIGTGLSMETTDGEDGAEWFIDMRVRSSLGAKNIMLSNGAGVIDKDYKDEIKVLLYNGNTYGVNIKKYDKIAQMIVMAHCSYVAKGVTFKYDKRDGGFGSSGE